MDKNRKPGINPKKERWYDFSSEQIDIFVRKADDGLCDVDIWGHNIDVGLTFSEKQFRAFQKAVKKKSRAYNVK